MLPRPILYLIILQALTSGIIVVLSISHYQVIQQIKTLQKGQQNSDVTSVGTSQIPPSLNTENQVKQTGLSTLPILPTDTTSPEQTLKTLQATAAALLTRIDALEKELKKQTSTSQHRNTATPGTQPFQKQVIFLGSASTTRRDWSDSGLEVTLDSADYPKQAQITFEAGMVIVGGEVWTRLKNKTTGVLLTATEMSHGTSNITWKTAPAITLAPGKNTYVVQLRSSSGENAQLSGARLVISK